MKKILYLFVVITTFACNTTEKNYKEIVCESQYWENEGKMFAEKVFPIVNLSLELDEGKYNLIKPPKSVDDVSCKWAKDFDYMYRSTLPYNYNVGYPAGEQYVDCFCKGFVSAAEKYILDNSDSSKKVKAENLQAVEERSSNDANAPEITFDFDTYDYGEVVEGEVVEVDFNFTNTGNSDLIIFNASASCGCTVPEYPQNKNIKPGESSSLKVRFDTSNKPGKQMKTVTLTTNTNSGRKLIRINGFVLNK